VERLVIALAVTAVCLVCNSFGTKTLALISKIGLAAELIGIILVGIYLLIFQRHNPISIFVHGMETGHAGSYFGAFLAASLVGLFLYYGLEACGEIAEEVPNPARRRGRRCVRARQPPHPASPAGGRRPRRYRPSPRSPVPFVRTFRGTSDSSSWCVRRDNKCVRTHASDNVWPLP
jgi:hypothetical protein